MTSDESVFRNIYVEGVVSFVAVGVLVFKPFKWTFSADYRGLKSRYCNILFSLDLFLECFTHGSYPTLPYPLSHGGEDASSISH